jgi:antitoxin component of MazEF toxin-antitoxin module
MLHIFLYVKSLYALQPYQVGSKDCKSLALIIPSKVAKQYNVDTSTVFTLRVDEDIKRITLQQTVNDVIMDNNHYGQKLIPQKI